MAFRFISLLPLLAICASAVSPEVGIQSNALNMSESQDAGLNMESVVPATANAPVVGATSLPSAEVQGAFIPGQPIITHAQANSIIQAAVKKSLEIKSPSNIAVTDPYGHLVSFLRMDGAVLASIDVSIKKAKTVSMFGGKFRTADLYNATSPGGSLFGKFLISRTLFGGC
jgi:uncharacterized protein GlcG (DUF336 family)